MQHDDAHRMTRVVVVRHGQTAWNVDNRIQGQLDVPLDARGFWQARQVGAALAGEGIDFLYASDLSRALDTARAVAAVTGLQIVTDTGLRERHFGVFQGLTFDEIGARWPEAAARWQQRDPSFGPDGGETLADFSARCIAECTRVAAAHAGGAIAIVAHGGVLDSLYRAATRIALDAPRTWKVANASINRMRYSPEGFTLVGWGDTAHLDASALDDPANSAAAPDAVADAPTGPRVV